MLDETAQSPDGLMTVHGLTLSYFTGKLEAYLRVKGIPYRFAEMDTAAFRRAGRATGVMQMPQIEMADGTWRTDTTAIMADFERRFPEPALSPSDPLTRFFSLLLEDYGDEWLWRPALHYRWSFDEDMTLMSAQIARTMLRDVKLPFWARRQFILRRQRRVYLAQDGVTKETIPQIEALYLGTLDAMEAVLAHRPFLMGERPVDADFGFFGSMFRHFSSDPTPAAIMRARAPHVLLWVARLWASRPEDVAHAALPGDVPDNLAPFLARIAGEYFPYLAANEAALARGEAVVSYRQGGVDWRVPASPYRAYCLAALRRDFAALDADARRKAAAFLGSGAKLLEGENLYSAPRIQAGANGKPLDRHWSGAATEGRT